MKSSNPVIPSDAKQSQVTEFDMTPVEKKEQTDAQEVQVLIEQMKAIKFSTVTNSFRALVLAMIVAGAVLYGLIQNVWIATGLFVGCIILGTFFSIKIEAMRKVCQAEWKVSRDRLKILYRTSAKAKKVVHEQGQTFERLRKEFPPSESSKNV